MAGYTLGIDVGTTFTAAATCRDGQTDAVGLGDHSDVVPTVAFVREDGVVLVGEAAERRAVSDPTRVARAFKRRLGDGVPLSLGDRSITAESLTAAVVRSVVDLVTAREGGPPDRTVLTLPASWRGHRRQALLAAAAEADVVDAELLAEPVAAARHYSARRSLAPGMAVGVYDLGGGTFDATIVRRTDEGFEVAGEPQGEDRLGGIDFDALVWEHVVDVVGAEALAPEDPTPHQLRALAQVRAAAVDAKEALSHDTQAVIPVTLPGLMTEVRLTRTEFEEMIRPALDRTVEVLARACEAAGVVPSELEAVLLVGGSSRIPLISQLIGHSLGARTVSEAHPKLATCLGAARAAADAPPPAADVAEPTTEAVPVPASVPVPDTAPVPAAVTAPVPAAAGPDGDGPATTGDDTGPRRGRRVLALATVLLVAVAATAGALQLRDDPGTAAPDDRTERTTTLPPSSSTSSSSTSSSTSTTDGTTDTTALPAPTTTAPDGTSPGTTAVPPTPTTAAPTPGDLCDPAAGDPDCTNVGSADGEFRTIVGYADCVESAPPGLEGSCQDLDGDGHYGYPDSG